MIKFQQSQALTSHFESFWSIVLYKKELTEDHPNDSSVEQDAKNENQNVQSNDCRLSRSIEYYGVRVWHVHLLSMIG